VSDPVSLLSIAYGDLTEALSDVAASGDGWAPTGCRGWTTHDLGYHLLGDARRALLALNSPTRRPADTDRVRYWRSWRPPEPEDDDALRRTRAMASIGIAFADLVQEYADTTAAVIVAADRAGTAEPVSTQGWVLSVEDLLSTLVVEAAVHHLDLVVGTGAPGPSAGPLAEVRRVLGDLLGTPLPSRWDDATAARRGTGREPLTAADRSELGSRVAEFPLFG
jgi:hypothetical protein